VVDDAQSTGLAGSKRTSMAGRQRKTESKLVRMLGTLSSLQRLQFISLALQCMLAGRSLLAYALSNVGSSGSCA
jgi:hypothetical protein